MDFLALAQTQGLAKQVGTLPTDGPLESVVTVDTLHFRVWARLAVLSGRIRRDLDEILPDQGKLVHGWAARKVSGKSAGKGKAKRSVAEPSWLAGSRNLGYVKASF